MVKSISNENNNDLVSEIRSVEDDWIYFIEKTIENIDNLDEVLLNEYLDNINDYFLLSRINSKNKNKVFDEAYFEEIREKIILINSLKTNKVKILEELKNLLDILKPKKPCTK